MSCLHDDCFTCPYPDCISKTEPKKRKCGRKKFPPEERMKRRRLRNKVYYEKHREERHEKYMQASEGKVKRRYRHKELSNDTET